MEFIEVKTEQFLTDSKTKNNQHSALDASGFFNTESFFV